MASKVVAQVPPMGINLKRAFENAVRDIYQPQSPQSASNYRRPIAQRPHTSAEGPANTQKRALSDAAKALAQLWKVSTGSGR